MASKALRARGGGVRSAGWAWGRGEYEEAQGRGRCGECAQPHCCRTSGWRRVSAATRAVPSWGGRGGCGRGGSGGRSGGEASCCPPPLPPRSLAPPLEPHPRAYYWLPCTPGGAREPPPPPLVPHNANSTCHNSPPPPPRRPAPLPARPGSRKGRQVRPACAAPPVTQLPHAVSTVFQSSRLPAAILHPMLLPTASACFANPPHPPHPPSHHWRHLHRPAHHASGGGCSGGLPTDRASACRGYA